ncbi:hypothetical protein ABPG74_020798 [Tetrahymena malaccensis]
MKVFIQKAKKKNGIQNQLNKFHDYSIYLKNQLSNNYVNQQINCKKIQQQIITYLIKMSLKDEIEREQRMKIAVVLLKNYTYQINYIKKNELNNHNITQSKIVLQLSNQTNQF